MKKSEMQTTIMELHGEVRRLNAELTQALREQNATTAEMASLRSRYEGLQDVYQRNTALIKQVQDLRLKCELLEQKASPQRPRRPRQEEHRS